MTQLLSISDLLKDKDILQEVKTSLSEGGIVAFPTETVYGIGALANSEKAITRIFAIKERDMDKALAYYCYDFNQLKELNIDVDSILREIYDTFLPGPLTLIVKDKNGKKIGLRYPNNEKFINFLRELPDFFVGTSANKSGEAPSLKSYEVYATFSGLIDYILEDDENVGKNTDASTVIDITVEPFLILRKGVMLKALVKFLEEKNQKYIIKKNILVVCTGNTCRSPMVERFLAKVIEMNNLSDYFNVSSCGIYAPFNVSASKDAIAVLAEDESIDLSSHRSKPLNDKMLNEADKILVMTPSHKNAIININPDVKSKIIILDIADPIGCGKNVYRETLNQIRRRIEENKDWILE